MNSTPLPPLSPALFAPSPARDERFVVQEHWVECANLPADDPRHGNEFLHRQMNEEINGMEVSAQCLADFPAAAWDLRLAIARQCADEARHVLMFQRLLEKRGGHVGEYPVLNFQYRLITRIDHLIGRLAVQNRSFEAEGLDAIHFGIGATRQRGDHELVALFEAQLADEIGHVRFANAWIREAVRNDPRSVLRISAALTAATKAFHEVMGPEGAGGGQYTANVAGRLEAGFLPEEVQQATALTAARHAARQSAEHATSTPPGSNVGEP